MSRTFCYRRVTAPPGNCRSKSTAPYGHQHAPVDVGHAQLWSDEEVGWQTDLVENAILQLHCDEAPTTEQTLPIAALRPREVARMRSSTENRQNCRVIPAALRSNEWGCSWPTLNDPELLVGRGRDWSAVR